MLKKRRQRWHLAILISAAVILILVLVGTFFHRLVSTASQVLAAVSSGAIFPLQLTHEQEVWLGALEWCESRGLKTAVNPKDIDGTPSYYSFQFKPSTFKLYGLRYGLFDRDITDEEVKDSLDNYSLQKRMVGLMLSDERVVWRREFPDCVRRIGLPPLEE